MGASVLPDDGVVDRLARAAVPDNSCFALVGDTHRGDVLAAQSAPGKCALDHFLGALPDLLRIVLDPARAGVDLLMLLLIDGHHVALVTKDHAAGARRALIDGSDAGAFSHGQFPLHVSGCAPACRAIDLCAGDASRFTWQ